MARPFLGARCVLGPGIYSRSVQTDPIQRLVSLTHFEHAFDKIIRGYDGAAITAWTNSATDNLNIASGFDPYFRIHSAATATGTPVCSIDFNGVLLKTGTADADDQIVSPISTAAIPMIGQNSATTGLGLNANGGYDVWINWIVEWPSDITLSNQIVCLGTMSDPASALTETNDQDFALFRVGTHAGTLNPRIYFDVVKDGGTVTTFDTQQDVTVGQTYVLSLRYRSNDQKFDLYVNRKFVGTTTATYRATDDSSVGVPLKPVLYHEVATASSSTASQIRMKGIVIDVDRET